MRRLVVIGAVAAVVAWAAIASPAGGEEEGAAPAAAAPAWVTVRLIRTEGAADLALRPGETRVAGEGADELLRRLRRAAGPEAATHWAVAADGVDGPHRLSLAERTLLVQDWETGADGSDPPVLKPVYGSIPEGASTEFRSRLVPDGSAVVMEVRARFVALVRPIASFDARISSPGPPRIIELPDLKLTSREAEIRVPVGSRGFVGLDLHTFLAIEVTADLPRDPFDRSVRTPR